MTITNLYPTTAMYLENNNLQLFQDVLDEIEEIGKGQNYICKKYFFRIAKRNHNMVEINCGASLYYHYSTTDFTHKNRGSKDWNIGNNEYGNVFGRYKNVLGETTTLLRTNKWYKISYKNPFREGSYFKQGIEILGCVPSKTTIDGKVREQRHTIKQLKAICKMNGLKGYSKCKKQGLYALLMTI